MEKNTLAYLYSLPIEFEFEGQYHKSLEKAISLIELEGDWCEFGVFEGRTAHILEKHIPENTNLYLFDSFEGLEEDWIVNDKVFQREGFPVIAQDGQVWDSFSKGCFNTTNIPVFTNKNVHLIKGMVENTVPFFVTSFSITRNRPLALIHMDLDLSPPTFSTLFKISCLIKTGTIILFDEYYNYGGDGWIEHEYTAFKKFLKCCPFFDFEYLFREDKFRVCVRMIKGTIQ